MASVHVERLDHLGLIACMIKDVGLIGMIDARLVPDEQEVLTPGEAVAGMILNGLGFSNRPLSLTPQFFANKPLDLLFREGVEAEMFNRFKLGRTLEEVSTYGCDGLLRELALAVCRHEGIDGRFNHLDTTSFSLSGDYVPEPGVEAIHITHGYSKDHRPDLKQAIVELMVSQDGGVPFVSKSWDGNTSDTQIFQERAQAMVTTFKPSSVTSGAVAMLPRAIKVCSYATMAWPSAGWWCIPRRLLRVPRRRSPKPSNANLRRSPSNCCTCTPDALRRPIRPMPLWLPWPSAGA